MSSPRLPTTVKKLLKAPLTAAAGALAPLSLSLHKTPQLTLMYHRILPRDDPRYATEEPGMIVTPESFARQIRTLKNLFTILPLAEWIERRQQGKPLPARSCAITFDDGWRDNFEFAWPILQREQVPATIFVVADMIGTRRQFWPNRLAALLSNGALLALGRDHPAFAWLRSMRGFNTAAGEDKSGLDREAIASVIDSCKALSDTELERRLDAMENAAGVVHESAALMDWEQLRSLQRSGLIEIGCHTGQHRRLLEDLPPDILQREVVASKQRIETELLQPVKLFCYPNGDASKAATQLVGRHYLAAVTTRSGINGIDTAAHQLFRIGIHEDVADTALKFRARLSGLL